MPGSVQESFKTIKCNPEIAPSVYMPLPNFGYKADIGCESVNLFRQLLPINIALEDLKPFVIKSPRVNQV